jgi:hypothetical protein
MQQTNNFRLILEFINIYQSTRKLREVKYCNGVTKIAINYTVLLI